MTVIDRQLERVNQGVTFSIRCCHLLADQGKSPATFLVPDLASRWQSVGSVRARVGRLLGSDVTGLSPGRYPTDRDTPLTLTSHQRTLTVRNLLKSCSSGYLGHRVQRGKTQQQRLRAETREGQNRQSNIKVLFLKCSIEEQ